VDEEFDRVRFNVIGGFDLEEVRGVVDEESLPILGGPVDCGVEDLFDGFWGDQVQAKVVQLLHLEGI
jgi:hypothetical protein